MPRKKRPGRHWKKTKAGCSYNKTMLQGNETQTNENRADHACPAHTTAYTSPTAGSKGGRNTPQPDNTATKGNDKRQTATMDKSDIINAIHSLPAGSMERMAACMEEVAYAKGTRILRAGKTERNVFFIKKGIVRAFVSTHGREITFWLGAEGTPVVSMKSYVSGLPGYESVECIEDTVLYVLRHDTLTSLFADDVNIANWGRRFAEKEMLRTEERLIPQLFTTAAERYSSLMANHPELLRRVPLEHLASYLGVTPVSLSRIRATLK